MRCSEQGAKEDSKHTVCAAGMCAGCMACIEVCPKSAITVVDAIDHMDAIIDSNLCIQCGLCHRVCQQNHPAALAPTQESWQGWSMPEVRRGSSSGGFASAIMKGFINKGGVVASCRLVHGDFSFMIARNEDQLKGFAGSKYVKSNPSGIYRKVRAEIETGNKVLFIGLPCQVSSMRNYIGMVKKGSLVEKLYTIDLICHGSPSIAVLKSVLEEYGLDIGRVDNIQFREKGKFALGVDGHTLVPAGCMDPYMMAFLRAGCYTQNCYQCHYATRNRVGDLTLGDSWGTELKSEESGGISLGLVQTQKGQELLDMGGLELKCVDYENAVAHNHQLSEPSKMSGVTETFFSVYRKTGSVRKATRAIYPKEYLKQQVKAIYESAKARHN